MGGYHGAFAGGAILGGLVSCLITVTILATFVGPADRERIRREWEKSAIESGVGRYNPQTAEFEFVTEPKPESEPAASR